MNKTCQRKNELGNEYLTCISSTFHYILQKTNHSLPNLIHFTVTVVSICCFFAYSNEGPKFLILGQYNEESIPVIK